MRLIPSLALALLAGLAGCGGPSETPGNEAAGAGNAAMAGNESAIANGAESGLTLDRLNAFGPVAIGDTVSDLRAKGLAVSTEEPLPGTTCSYARVAALPDAGLMLDGDKVVRIDVTEGNSPTLGGVTIGDSEKDALAALGPDAKVEPERYTGPIGHNILVHAPGAAHGLILTTDGKKVLNYRFGQWEQVQWVEGCA